MSAKQILAVLTFLSLVIGLSEQLALYDGGLWPPGDYALLKPRSGCPTNTFDHWEKSQVLFRTEHNSSRNAVSRPDHLDKPIWYSGGKNTFIIQHFCLASKYSGKVTPVEWPSGSYCILGKNLNSCPRGFSSGKVTWLTGNTTTLSIVKGTPVAGSYLWNSIQLGFCCRSDGSANESITLPVGSPFFLYRKGGICQKVRAATITEEFVRFDTVEVTESPVPEGDHPDISDYPDVKQHLCYYSRDYTWQRPTAEIPQ